MIETIFNRNVGNTFHHKNGKNQRQHIHETLVKSITLDPIKYQGPHKLHT